MALKVCILGSGSAGNCTYIGSPATGLLIDAGLSAREIARRLAEMDLAAEQVHGVCVSHEHQDHVAGLRVLHQKHGVAIYANQGTRERLVRDPKMEGVSWRVFETGSAFEVGDLKVEPFAVPHDAMEPVGFVVSHGDDRVGIVTDMGMATSLIRERLRKCRALVVEANYDEQLLQASDRPWQLKQRISGRQGHLSNQRAAAMIAEVAGPHLHQVFLAHLSDECNRHDLAWRTTRDELARCGHTHVNISLTFADRRSEVWAC